MRPGRISCLLVVYILVGEERAKCVTYDQERNMQMLNFFFLLLTTLQGPQRESCTKKRSRGNLWGCVMSRALGVDFSQEVLSMMN